MNPVLPELKSKIGARGLLKDPVTKEKLGFQILDEIRQPQSDLPSKIIVLQKIKFDDGRFELRLGYYIIGKRPGMKGKWTWGQYATFLPLKDFRSIIKEAENRKGFLEE
jgi:hypothetical protein